MQQASHNHARGAKPYTLKTVLTVMGGAAVISFSAVFARLSETGPVATGAWRLGTGAAVLGLVLVARQLINHRPAGNPPQPLLKARFKPALLPTLAGLVFALDLYFWHRSILFVGPGLATVLGNFQVFIMALLGALLYRERPGMLFMAAALLAFSGLGLLVSADFLNAAADYRTGVAYGLLTALCYAVYMVLLKSAAGQPGACSAEAAIALASLSGCLALSLTALAEDEVFFPVSSRGWLVVTAYGICGQALGWVMISRGLAVLPTALAGLVILVQPALSFLWDVLFFNRNVTLIEGAGLLVVLAALYLAVARPARQTE